MPSRWARDRIPCIALALIVVAAIGGAACATTGGAPPSWNQPESRRVWPDAPDLPRIEYIGAIHAAPDIRSRAGLWSRLVAAILGTAPSEMIRPVAVSRNARGLLVVADPGIPTVHFFDLAAERYWRLGPEHAGLLRSPVGVAVDDAGRVYVSDSVRSRVFVFDRGGSLLREMGSGILERPTGLALGPDQDRLYVVDTVGCRVVVFDRSGQEVQSIGRRGDAPGEFNYPTFIGIGPDGGIGVSDSLNFRVQVFRADRSVEVVFGRPGDGPGHFARPKGVAVDRDGRLFVADAAFDNVQIFDETGAVLMAFSGPGVLPGDLSLPGGIFADGTDTIWVADSLNRRVQAFRLLGDRE